jgi:hypothetical protein
MRGLSEWAMLCYDVARSTRPFSQPAIAGGEGLLSSGLGRGTPAGRQPRRGYGMPQSVNPREERAA